jgi:molybdopterin-synthase adenylyltransferase
MGQTSERYSRNIALFGEAGQEKIRACSVLICGLGGLGSHVAQQLAYLGVGELSLLDFDIVTESNLNRLVGAGDADIKSKKTTVAARVIREANSEVHAREIDGKVESADTESAIARSDVVFGCLDKDIHRLTLLDLAVRHAKPYFDLASDTGGEGARIWYGGRVVLSRQGGCLLCRGILDQQSIVRDRMTPDQEDAYRRIYGVDVRDLAGTGPSVVSINGVVGSLGVTEFMVEMTGLRRAVSHLTYRAEWGIVTTPRDEPRPGCYYCSGLWGENA